MRAIDDAERRRRLAVRQALSPAHRATDPVAATRRVVALHGTDPATIFMSARARAAGMEVADLEGALYRDRHLVRVMAMRRTIWIVPDDLVGAAIGGPGRRVAERERARLIKDVESHELRKDGARWIRQARRQVLDVLADGRSLSMDEIRAEAPALRGAIRQGVGKRWEAEAPIGPRVLTWLWAGGDVVRSTNDGSWRASRPRWASTDAWLPVAPNAVDAPDAWTELVRRYLAAFGPATETDVVWWLGANKGIVRAALADLGAEEVALAGGATGLVLPGDEGATVEVDPWGALLPGLDPTTMGWKERAWYLGPHAPELVDNAGNAGPTIWWDGRIVGGWHQSEDGAIGMVLLEDVGHDAVVALEAHAGELESWLGGDRVMLRFPSPLFQRSVGRPPSR
ncbi:winged helix DNA-binding domain-containing protein [Dermatobacter hominis]|uniref:winged helix DNA-binding domain-containing protein n=1 Tax=Dermatobacter hominis TaxID=2884263 RepID=UPI001D10955C|nr:winged helix DNA-binding domain-containing protein [Dermatobacter hominis]UDY34129.1 winged helix DNA-binding domain-containing protein [Dermatobacter hominis]